jgi:DNA-binding MarR family transcriptional regulator
MTTREIAGDFDVDYELTRFLRESRQYAMSRLSEIHPELDYSSFLLLVAIADTESGSRASDLAEDLRVHKSTISRAVTTLERLELIERQTHPEDARSQLLTVRPEARERLEAFRLRSHAWLARLLSEWGDEDVSSLGRMLARLNDAVGRGYAGLVTMASTMFPDIEPFLLDVGWI